MAGIGTGSKRQDAKRVRRSGDVAGCRGCRGVEAGEALLVELRRLEVKVALD